MFLCINTLIRSWSRESRDYLQYRRHYPRDSADLIRKLSGRITQLHLEDLDRAVVPPQYDSVPKEAFKELGNGVIAMEPILAAAADANVAHCHVEQDHSPHPIKSVQQSIAFLKTL